MTEKTCMWASRHRSKFDKRSDLHIVKEKIKTPEGDKTNVRLVKNYQRPYYVTLEGERDHKQKRDYEHKKNLKEYWCTQAELPLKSARSVGLRVPGGFIKQSEVNRSPYLYGTDFSSASWLKYEYLKECPDYKPPATVGVMDFETDAVNGDIDDKVIIAGAYTMKDHITLATTKEFVSDIPDAERTITNAFLNFFEEFKDDVLSQVKEKTRPKVKEYLDGLKERPDLHIHLVDRPYDVAKKCYDAAHETMPDYLTFWNSGFDIKASQKACELAGESYESLFCDPRIPKEFQHFYFKEDFPKKEKANGETLNKGYMDLWHKVYCPASFKIVCSMAFYRLSRIHQGKFNSYGLEATLKRELGLGKLKFEKGKEFSGVEWHRFMQTQNKVDYLIYNIFDCILTEILQFVIKDLPLTFGEFVLFSEPETANSNPRMLADDMHVFLYEQDKVISSTSDQMREELDKNLIGTREWIVTLPSELVKRTGRRIVKSLDMGTSRFSAHSGDIDIESAYPTAGARLNVSRDSTMVEFWRKGDLEESTLRQVSVNFTALETNAAEISRKLYSLPSLFDAVDMI